MDVSKMTIDDLERSYQGTNVRLKSREDKVYALIE